MNEILEKYLSSEKPSEEMISYYNKRTKEHINRVKRNIEYVITKLDLTKQEKEKLKKKSLWHDASKFEDDEYIPYIWMSWYYKLKREGKEFKYPKGVSEKITKAVEHHYKANNHHPQYYNDDTNKMSKVDIIEMVCDHAAMSQELGDSLIDFEHNVTFKKFKWSDINKDFILKVASLFHK